MPFIDKSINSGFASPFVSGYDINFISNEFSENISFDKIAFKILIKLCNGVS